MAHSLSDECTPLKHKYDSCFNAWFEGYLEPAMNVSADAQQRETYSKQKAAEYEEKCGKIWESYRLCVQVRRFRGSCGGLLLTDACRKP